MRFLLLIPGLACLFLGAVFLLVFRMSRNKQEEEEQRFTGRAWARLADTGSKSERDPDGRAHTVYFGIYEYDTADGQRVTSASEFCYGNEQDIPGTQGNMVKICYDPRKPTDYALPEEQAITLRIMPTVKKIGIWLMILGVLLTLAAAAVISGVINPEV